MAIGEVFLGAFLQVLLDRLTPHEILNYFGRVGRVGKKLEKWRATLTEIGEVLNDAEEKQLTEDGVKRWLVELRDLAYDVDDLLNKYATKKLDRQIEQQADQVRTSSMVRWSSISNCVFNFKMNSEIQKITERLQMIIQEKGRLSLSTSTAGASSNVRQHLPPSSSHPDGPVIGRDEDERRIVEMLTRKERRTANFDVVAIVGMPGLGKTTLAGKVFSDIDATQQFKPKAWVCVSDDFNLERVTKKIFESITCQHHPTGDFGQVQDALHKELAGKKFLIVPDDVWDTCSYGQWMKLQSPFRDGAPGSKIIVTTRDATVPKMMGAAALVHNLELMSDDACFEVFQQHAFLDVNSDEPPGFELLLKEKIVARCSGLPLAARTLGGVLRCKEIDKWEDILKNKLWSLTNEQDVLPVLRLSYHYLPPHLKRCFAYCSILPNDYEFGEKQLILLWMAEGLIQPRPEDNKQLEDLAADYFGELLSRSLFQRSSKNTSKYVMHDLVGDLARWAAGEICFRLDDKQNTDGDVQLGCYRKARHASYIAGHYDGVERFEAFSGAKRLRTFLPLSIPTWNYLSRKVTFDLLPTLQYLRVLSFKGYRITELPNSIDKLKHVRYLDLSDTLITSLPESTTNLCNLQTLILEGCSKLKALPRNLRNLVNLRHLDNSGSCWLEAMPPQLGRLTNLQSLPNFVVGKGSDQSGIREIGSLVNLRGSLCLSRLENVINVEDARSANLTGKERLEELLLEWSSGTEETELGVLERLEPHRKLRELTVRGYAGSKFSTWIGDPLFSTMVHVTLDRCENCQTLPPLGQLPSLKELRIKGMTAVESVGPEFYGGGRLPFPALEVLEFDGMQHWEKWLPFDQDQGSGVFPCLKRLSIRRCPKLEGKLPENLDSLAELKIYECEELVVSIANYKQVCELDIDGCKGVVRTSEVEFELLESLRLSNISELKLQTGEFTKGFTKVIRSEQLKCTMTNGDRLFQHLISLLRLEIKGNSSLVEELGKEAEESLQLPIFARKLEYFECFGSLWKVPKGLHHLTALQELGIYACRNLESFPDAGGLPPSLKVIRIKCCDSLMYLAKYEIPPNLRRIEISHCASLKSLVEEEVEIVGSSSSSSSSQHRQFPKALKHLEIYDCEELELITPNGFSQDSTSCLESIDIWICPNLKCLPEGLCHLTNLHELYIGICRSLVSIPRLSSSGGLPLPTTRASNLRSIQITNCEKLEEFPISEEDMQNLNSLEELAMDCREGGFTSFPLNLISLTIRNINKSFKRVRESGLHRLTSLRKLSIQGGVPDLVSFPPDKEKEMLLPKSLTHLHIDGFPNLQKLSRSMGFQFLTSLQSLRLCYCPKLASICIPEQGLPLSLTQLYIEECPKLAERCKPPSKGRFYSSSSSSYWPQISHIPCIQIDRETI